MQHDKGVCLTSFPHNIKAYTKAVFLLCKQRHVLNVAMNILQQMSIFCKAKTGKDGLRSDCKVCTKKYKTDNKNHIKEQRKQYNLEHKQQRKECFDMWIKNNKEHVKEHRREYLKENATQIRKRKNYIMQNIMKTIKRE